MTSISAPPLLLLLPLPLTTTAIPSQCLRVAGGSGDTTRRGGSHSSKLTMTKLLKNSSFLTKCVNIEPSRVSAEAAAAAASSTRDGAVETTTHVV